MSGFEVDLAGLDLAAAELRKHQEHATAIDDMFGALRDHQRRIVHELRLAHQTLTEIRSGYAKGCGEPDTVTTGEAGLGAVTAALAGWHGAAAQAFRARIDEIQRQLRNHACYTEWLHTHLTRYNDSREALEVAVRSINAHTEAIKANLSPGDRR